MSELGQTKSSFKVIGKVTRIDKDGAFREDQATRGQKEGETYHSLRFGIKTSETNEVTVEMFDFEPKEVFLWHSEKGKEAKEKGGKYKGLRVPFGEWLDKRDELREQGHSVLQSRIGLTYGEDGKIKSKGLPKFVASEEIYENLNNGDSVVIEGEVRYSSYKNQQDKVVERKQFSIEKAFKLKNIDFEDEKFEEVSYFEQEMVFIDAEDDKEEGKVFVKGRMIDFMKNWHDSEFVISYRDENGEEDKDLKKLANAVVKKMKFGDKINAFGNVVNRVVMEEVEEDEEESEEDKMLASLGGKSKPRHAQSYQNRTYISEMQILGIDAWDKKFYTEEDFVKDEVLEDNDDDDKLNDELGGKKKKDKNPFKTDIDEDDISEDDLPF